MADEPASFKTLHSQNKGSQKKRAFQVQYIELHNFLVTQLPTMKDIIAIKYKSPICHLSFFSSASVKYNFHLSEHFQSERVFLFVKGDRR